MPKLPKPCNTLERRPILKRHSPDCDYAIISFPFSSHCLLSRILRSSRSSARNPQWAGKNSQTAPAWNIRANHRPRPGCTVPPYGEGTWRRNTVTNVSFQIFWTLRFFPPRSVVFCLTCCVVCVLPYPPTGHRPARFLLVVDRWPYHFLFVVPYYWSVCVVVVSANELVISLEQAHQEPTTFTSGYNLRPERMLASIFYSCSNLNLSFFMSCLFCSACFYLTFSVSSS